MGIRFSYKWIFSHIYVSIYVYIGKNWYLSIYLSLSFYVYITLSSLLLALLNQDIGVIQIALHSPVSKIHKVHSWMH